MSLVGNGARRSGRVVDSVSLDKWVQVNAATSKPYIAYVITVHLPPVQQWTVKRRYNEFSELATTLAGEPPQGAGQTPPLELPPKRAVQTGWRQRLAFGGTAAQEHAQELAEERLPALKAWIDAIVQHSNPIWRSSRAFRSFLALPDDAQFNVAIPKPKGARDSGGIGARPNNVPGGWNGTNVRRLGAAALEPEPSPVPRKAEETSFTRGLDDQELFDSQANVMERQDGHLRNLAAAIRRQRELGLTINQELHEQTEMLGQLDGDLDSVQGKMSSGSKLMRKLDHDRPY